MLVSRKRLRASLLLACGIALSLPRAGAQSRILEADLTQALNADHLEEGSSFALRTLTAWTHHDCQLAPGTLVQATVRRLQRDAHRHTGEITLQLSAPCGGDNQPVPLLVSSLLAPTVAEDQQPLPSFFGGMNPGAGAPRGPSQAFYNSALASSENGSGARPSLVQTGKLPRTVTAGEVWHLPHIRLSVPPAGAESTISTSAGSLHLPRFTVVVLTVAGEGGPAPSALPALAPVAAPQVRRGFAPFLHACRSATCSVYHARLPAEDFGVGSPRVAQDLLPLGFVPEHRRDLLELDSGATVNFLTDQEVLVTFPTHQLVRRTGVGSLTGSPRSIRAVLFNTASATIERTEDWTVDDHKTYVWPLGSNLVVHDGEALHLLGPDLQRVAELPLALPLASLRVSPDGEHLLLGEVHELHTPEEHDRLRRVRSGNDPEEEVFWSLLDTHLERTRSFGATAEEVPPPVLLHDGLVELRRGQPDEWFLAKRTWAATEDELLGSLHSSCLPLLGSMPPNLLLITTCDSFDRSLRSAVVREDGSPVFEQAGTSQDLPASYAVAQAAPRLAMLTTRADRSYTPGVTYSAEEFASQIVQVRSTADGGTLAGVRLPEATPYARAFALSPHGETLAVLAGHSLLLYSLSPVAR